MPSNNIELEAKVLLSKKDYEKLLKSLPWDKETKIQNNYYLETDDRLLKKYSMVIRLRTREGKNKLTLKAPLGEGLLDKSQILTDEQKEMLINSDVFPSGDIADFLDILHIDKDSLKIQANLVTERKECKYDNSEIDLSKNTYSDTIDYELECDSDSFTKSQNVLKSICDKYAIEFKLNTLSKEERAISTSLNK